MKTLNTLLFLLVTILLTGSAYGQTTTKTGGSAAFEQMMNKLRSGDTSVDFKALRFAYAETPIVEAAVPDMKFQAAMIKFLNEKNFKEAVKTAEALQRINYLDMNSHVIASMAYQGLGDAKKSKLHEAIYVGLVNSIIKDADGNTPQTAYIVISAAEEYVVLNALDLKRVSHAAIEEGGHKFDVLQLSTKYE